MFTKSIVVALRQNQCLPKNGSCFRILKSKWRNQSVLAFSTSTTTTSNNDADIIEKYSKERQTAVSLQQLMQTGRGEFIEKTDSEQTATQQVLQQVASFLHRELPIRLAHRIHELDRVPYMKDMPAVQNVKELYTRSFFDLINFQSENNDMAGPQEEERFSQLIERIYQRHSKVLIQMARGAYEFRHALQTGQIQDVDCLRKHTSYSSRDGLTTNFAHLESTHEFLDRFYLCRIGIRVLIGQYLALRQPPLDTYVGLVCSQTSPYEIVKRAIDDAAFMCTRKYGDAPEVTIRGKLEQTFPYVPTHLHYIMLELLKNSMRATMDWHLVNNDENDNVEQLPPIQVVIADGQDNEDVVIKVSDEGGGIPRSNMKQIWSYLFTTADPSIQESIMNHLWNADHGIDAPLAGLGYGLPISRSYCRYFGGDLSIMSMEGHGTDAFVHLTRLGDSREPIPV